MPIIRATDVHKSFQLGERRVEALRGVNFEIDSPGFVAVMGPSGSGKSTLLHLLAGLDRPDEGTIEVSGDRIDNMDESALTAFRRHKIGIVFQRYNLISTLTALENAMLPGMLDGMPMAERRRRGTHLLEMLGLGERMDHRPDALSGGEQQRVAIARSLLFEPPVLLADEPTGNLDTTTAAHLWTLLREVTAERSITLLLVTHEPSSAVHCDRVVLFRDGVVTGDFQTEGIDAVELATRAQRTDG
jgi:putative ABC transport system ATP-binding protein